MGGTSLPCLRKFVKIREDGDETYKTTPTSLAEVSVDGRRISHLKRLPPQSHQLSWPRIRQSGIESRRIFVLLRQSVGNQRRLHACDRDTRAWSTCGRSLPTSPLISDIHEGNSSHAEPKQRIWSACMKVADFHRTHTTTRACPPPSLL